MTRRAILIVVLVVLTVAISWLMWHPRGDTVSHSAPGDVPTGLPPD